MIAAALGTLLSVAVGVAAAQGPPGLGAVAGVVAIDEDDRVELGAIDSQSEKATTLYVTGAIAGALGVGIGAVLGPVLLDSNEPYGLFLAVPIGSSLAFVALVVLGVAIGLDLDSARSRERWLERIGLASARASRVSSAGLVGLAF